MMNLKPTLVRHEKCRFVRQIAASEIIDGLKRNLMEWLMIVLHRRNRQRYKEQSYIRPVFHLFKLSL